MKKLFQDFKTFIMRGNVVDLAVAVIIGTAFGRIIQSLVRDILMPIISLAIGKDGFENYKYVITPENPMLGITENAIYYGLFIQNVIDFIIIALVIFFVIKLMMKAQELAHQKRLEEEKRVKEALEKTKKDQPTVESLLTDIKKLLAEQAK
ncbi:MAG: large conductance mechanosensitive channel protein MscL [Candidatus Izemoplasmataceae bacterium]|uniref:large conductance mechanosensitive channel protein MscL n=1 Tax=Liberiplasma polymorphum TaxID=3374570 RepID=UPI003770B1FF